MEKGFTLVELLATLALFILILVLAIPAIVSQVNSKKEDISDATLKILYDASTRYMDDNNILTNLNAGDSYCVMLDTLVQNDYLQSPIKDVNNGGEISLTKKVKTTINSNLEYDNFELVDNCN